MAFKYTYSDYPAVGNLSTALGSGDMTLTLDTGDGSNFPVSGDGLGEERPSLLTLRKYINPTDTTSGIEREEKILVSTNASDIMTIIQRGYDDTTPSNFDIGDFVYILWEKRAVNDIYNITAEVDASKTVKPSGGDYTTIQDAINFFSNKNAVRSRIDTNIGSYDEDISFNAYLATGEDDLRLVGDLRELAGLSYVDNTESNPDGLTNGGAGIVSLSNSGNDLTVSCATTNPDFDSDSWVSGDNVYIYGNGGSVTEHTIASTLGNVITLTASVPNVGNTGTTVSLVPNRTINLQSSQLNIFSKCEIKGFRIIGDGVNPVVTANRSSGVLFEHCIIDGNGQDGLITGASGYIRMIEACTIVHCANGVDSQGSIQNSILLTNVVSIGDNSGRGFQEGNFAGCIAINYDYGIYTRFGQNVQAFGSQSIDCNTAGFYSETNGTISAQTSTAENCGIGYHAYKNGMIHAQNATASNNTTGYKADRVSYINAVSTSSKNVGNTTNYNPATNEVAGNINSYITFT